MTRDRYKEYRLGYTQLEQDIASLTCESSKGDLSVTNSNYEARGKAEAAASFLKRLPEDEFEKTSEIRSEIIYTILNALGSFEPHDDDDQAIVEKCRNKARKILRDFNESSRSQAKTKIAPDAYKNDKILYSSQEFEKSIAEMFGCVRRLRGCIVQVNEDERNNMELVAIAETTIFLLGTLPKKVVEYSTQMQKYRDNLLYIIFKCLQKIRPVVAGDEEAIRQALSIIKSM